MLSSRLVNRGMRGANNSGLKPITDFLKGQVDCVWRGVWEYGGTWPYGRPITIKWMTLEGACLLWCTLTYGIKRYNKFCFFTFCLSSSFSSHPVHLSLSRITPLRSPNPKSGSYPSVRRLP